MILSRLKCDFIVRYYSAWRESSTLYIQTEFCYTTLKSAIEKINFELNKNEPNIFTRIGFYISSALSEELINGVNYLHKQNPPIIHRDLKPQNILISYGTDAKFVKIADFGLSTVYQLDGDSLTKCLRTDRYTAPEVMKGKKYGVKADIYSLGVILEEIFNIDINELIES
jgi:serine/threonine protein kinase